MASSAFYEVYKLLPNDTDFTVLNNAEAQGLNFAYLDGIQHYHTLLDNAQEINPRTLQDLGANAVALTKHFGNTRSWSKDEGCRLFQRAWRDSYPLLAARQFGRAFDGVPFRC